MEGRILKLSNGEERKILMVDIGMFSSDEYIRIFLDGGKLDGSKVGFPQKFEFVE
ncbi:MAG: hypothetical protein HY887_04795 [Deltaproteobacteria bacterium]|nr:hypothetical protein [Deltaproteobacteria bacterium]